MNRKKLQNIRNNRTDQQGTAPLSFLNSGDIDVDTNAGGWIIDFMEESKTARYYPFDFLQINNNSGSALNIFINQNKQWQKIARAGVIENIRDFKGIRGVRISKRDASVTIAAGEVEVTVMKQPLSDDEFRRREVNRNPIGKIFRNFLGV